MTLIPARKPGPVRAGQRAEGQLCWRHLRIGNHCDAHGSEARPSRGEAASWISVSGSGVVIAVHVSPGAPANGVAGLHGDALKIRVHASPVEGRANRELVRFLAERLDVPRASLAITSGETGRRKRILVGGLSESEVRERLKA